MMTLHTTQVSASRAMMSVLGEDAEMMHSLAKVGDALASAGYSRGAFAAILSKPDFDIAMAVMKRIQTEFENQDRGL